MKIPFFFKNKFLKTRNFMANCVLGVQYGKSEKICCLSSVVELLVPVFVSGCRYF